MLGAMIANTPAAPPTSAPLFVVTNDDGIMAEGLAALVAAARRAVPGARVVVVAPAREQSQCGHRLTTQEPLRVESLGPDRHAVHGSPADCVRIALFALGLRPWWVLSGINHGGNMGQDLAVSGTVAAAREAAYHGLPAAAFSHYLIRGLAVDWTRATEWSARVLESLLAQPVWRDGFHNVNLPHLPPGELAMPEMVPAMPARSPLRVRFEREAVEESGAGAPARYLYHYKASYAERPRDPGSDVEVCFGGRIAWSRVGL